jgi:hypothetical protein
VPNDADTSSLPLPGVWSRTASETTQRGLASTAYTRLLIEQTSSILRSSEATIRKNEILFAEMQVALITSALPSILVTDEQIHGFVSGQLQRSEPPPPEENLADPSFANTIEGTAMPGRKSEIPCRAFGAFPQL